MDKKIITTIEEFDNLKDTWEVLQEADPDVTYYSTYEFIRTWWDVYKDDSNKSLFIVCIYHNNNIVGIAPFFIEMCKSSVLSWKELTFLGKGDYSSIILDKRKGNETTIIAEIFHTIDMSKNLWDRIYFTHIKHNSVFAFYLFRNIKYNKYFLSSVECPYLDTNKYKDFEQYKKHYISSSANKYRNKLKRETNYCFKVINNKNDYDMYNVIKELHIKEQQYRVKNGEKTRQSPFLDEKRSNFINNIFLNNEKVITFVLEDRNGKVIIYDTCYLYKGVLHSWNTAYDPEFEKYNTGRIINSEIIEYIFESKISNILDFGTGRYPWKFEWTCDFIYDYHLDMWNDNTKKSSYLKILRNIKNKLEELKD